MKLYADLTYPELTVMRYAVMEERNEWIKKNNPLSLINEAYLKAWKIRNKDVIKTTDPETGLKKTLYRYWFQDNRFIEKILDDYQAKNPDEDISSIYGKIRDYRVRGGGRTR